ncbi:MAG: RidA family protein [Chloroflexi bacterium]|nr:RidA family protein [Chloroflexota bacterium]
MTKAIITTKNAPKAIGPYSAGVRTGNLIYTAGQLGIDPLTGEFVSDEVVKQTRQALKNLKAILEAGDSALENVVKTTVFLRDMNDFAAMNAVYAEFFTENFPARSAVQVARLPKDAAVEIEAVAIVIEQ